MRVVGEPRVVVNDRAIVGECPMWSVREQALYWLDGRRDAFYRLGVRTEERASWNAPAKPNAIAMAGERLVVGMKSGIAFLDPRSGTFTQITGTRLERDDMKVNDGKVDRQGRFWYGLMHDDATTPIGGLYSLEQGRVVRHDGGFTIPNGFAWSPDGRTMYVSDTKLGTIYAYPFDLPSGELGQRRAFVQGLPAGIPDGATVDERGFLWTACVGGFAIARYAPDGALDTVVELPVERPTSVIFGGEDLRTLYVTTATRTLSEEQLRRQPLAGAVLALRVDVPGLPEPDFAG